MRYVADLAMWSWCWLASTLVSVLPWSPRGSWLDRFTVWLLPYAGFYAYHEPDCGSTWRWSERVRR